MQTVNISAYRFVPLDVSDLSDWCITLKREALDRQLKGSILLSREGINLSVAGSRAQVDSLKLYLGNYSQFQNLDYKESWSVSQPFKRMLVKIKPEIVAFGNPGCVPSNEAMDTYITPQSFKRWYDEARDMMVLDVRNDYEIKLGTFKKAVHLNIHRFKDLRKKIKTGELKQVSQERPIVTLCTGGIRCEKVVTYLKQEGIEQVYQLQGGILKYFEVCGKAYYLGECFVFDKRIGVDEHLKETPTIQCLSCRSPLRLEERNLSGQECPYCGDILRDI